MKLRWVTALVAAIFVLNVARASAQSPVPCDQVVYDGAQIFGDRIGEVEQAADEIVKLGADVRVFTVQTTSLGNLDLFVDGIEDQCLSWQDSQGGTKNNIIIVGISLEEKKTSIFYGDRWKRVLDPSYTAIQADRMNPRFRDGDFAGGFIDGLREIQRIVDLEVHPPTQKPEQKEVVIVIPTPVPATPREPVDLSGLWRVLLLLVGLIAGALVVYFAFTFVTSYLAHTAKRRGAQQRARLSKQSVSSRLADQGELEALRVKIESLVEQAGGDLVKKWITRLGEVTRIFDAVNEDYTGIGRAAGDPDDPRLTAEQFEAQEAAFNSLLNRLDSARAIFQEVQQEVQELEKVVEQALDLIAELEARIEKTKGLIEVGAQLFAAISVELAESSWQAIRGNGTEATNRINWSLSNVQEARLAASENRFGDVQENLREANAWLDEAESFMRSISALKTSLEAAKRDAANEIQAAQTDIDKAKEYISTYDADIRESLEDDLRTAQKTLDQSTSEAEREQPDWLKVVKLAKQANESADAILADARSEHEAAERLRAKAASSLREARSSVSRAKEYIEDHSRDVERDARQHLKTAQEYLGKAESASTLQSQIEYAEKAEEYADSAYSEAKSDFNAAEERRRPRHTTVVVSHRESHTGSGDWGTWNPTPSRPSHTPAPSRPSGGSSSWGSGSRRSGGSSSWSSPSISRPSGGGRSGGSTGW